MKKPTIRTSFIAPSMEAFVKSKVLTNLIKTQTCVPTGFESELEY